MNDQNPYANDGMSGGYDEYAGPERTSALAVLSLILSLACCIPGLGLLGAGLGVGALIGISGSRGRVGGKGLAVAGIIVGILVSVAWVGGYVAFQQGVGQLLTSTGSIVERLDTGDYDGFRATSSSPASDLSDAEYAAFVADYQAQLGSYVSVPDSIFAWIEDFTDPAVGQMMQGTVPQQNAIPVPVAFDNGTTVVFIVADQQTGDPFSPIDLVYKLPDGTDITLSDYLGTGAAPAPTPSAGGSGDSSDVDSDDETGDEDEESDGRP